MEASKVSFSRPPERTGGGSAPFLAWPQLYSYLKQNFRQGDHVASLGQTGSGKTHVALAVAELRSYTILVACKPKDPLVDDAVRRGYWLVPTDRLEVPYVDSTPLHRKVVYWPRLPDRARRAVPQSQLLAAERAYQKPRVAAALGYVRQAGHWSLVVDEGTWVCRDLGLQRDVDSALFQFRTLDSSLIILGQRPSWMGRYVLSQPTHMFLFNTNDREDRKALGDISGTDTALVRDIVGDLNYEAHEFLYIDTRKRQMFRSVAPAR